MAKWRPGSAGEKEQREQVVILIFLALVAVGVFSILFFIPNDVRTNVIAAPTVMNIIGGILVLGSGVPVVLGFKSQDGVKSHILAWVVLLAAGILIAAGFFSYTY